MILSARKSSLYRRGYEWEGLWANRPAATAFRAGATIYVSDIGSAGSEWVSDGTRWYPLDGTVNLYTLAAPVTGIGTTNTIVAQYLIPAGLLQVNDVMRVWAYHGKTGTTDTCDFNQYIGTAGTTGDTNIGSGSCINAANQTTGGVWDWELNSATSLQPHGTGTRTFGSYNVGTSGAPAAAITITSAAANALYLSHAIASSGATDTVSCEGFMLQIVSKQ